MRAGSIRGRLSEIDDREEKTIESACARARGAMRDAVDLLLIHNEKTVRGDQPRAVLSPLIVLLGVSAWERLIYETGEAIGYQGPANGGKQLRTRQTVGRLSDQERPSSNEIGPSVAHEIVSQATSGVLPKAWSITFYQAPYGKKLDPTDTLDGDESYAVLADRFDHYVDLRNGVAHRVLPAKMRENLTDYSLRTDAGKDLPNDEDHLKGLTINTSLARMVLASCIQLIDQSIACLLASHGDNPGQASKYRLPTWWFDDDGNGDDSSRATEPGDLWGGIQVPRGDVGEPHV